MKGNSGEVVGQDSMGRNFWHFCSFLYANILCIYILLFNALQLNSCNIDNFRHLFHYLHSVIFFSNTKLDTDTGFPPCVNLDKNKEPFCKEKK